MKVAVTTSSFGVFCEEPLNILKKNKFEIVRNSFKRQLTEDEAIEILADCHGVIAGTEPLTENVLKNCPKLKVISRCGVGIDNIDLEAAKKQNIIICSTPEAPTLAVVELTLAFALSMLRKIPSMSTKLSKGVWEKETGQLLSNKTIGIIGFGRIGKAVANIFKALGCTIRFYDPNVKQTGSFLKCSSIDFLVQTSDIITLHCSLPEDKKPVLNAQLLAKVKEHSYIINTARGGLIDEQALYECLKDGRISGAALDVFSVEPYKGKLLKLKNVLLTPHIASYAKETRIDMEKEATLNLIKSLV